MKLEKIRQKIIGHAINYIKSKKNAVADNSCLTILRDLDIELPQKGEIFSTSCRFDSNETPTLYVNYRVRKWRFISFIMTTKHFLWENNAVFSPFGQEILEILEKKISVIKIKQKKIKKVNHTYNNSLTINIA